MNVNFVTVLGRVDPLKSIAEKSFISDLASRKQLDSWTTTANIQSHAIDHKLQKAVTFFLPIVSLPVYLEMPFLVEMCNISQKLNKHPTLSHREISRLKSERDFNTEMLSCFGCYIIPNYRVLPFLAPNRDACL